MFFKAHTHATFNPGVYLRVRDGRLEEIIAMRISTA